MRNSLLGINALIEPFTDIRSENISYVCFCFPPIKANFNTSKAPASCRASLKFEQVLASSWAQIGFYHMPIELMYS